jgi:hypothetical protein
MQDNQSAFESSWAGYTFDESPVSASMPDTGAFDTAATINAERPAVRRRRERIALIQEFGGHAADLKAVAAEAIRRGMYSPRTNRGDVELCLMRTWKLRNRGYAR